MSKGDFFRVIFDGAVLGDVDLNRTNLARASFRKAVLKNVNLDHAFLYKADITGLDLSDTRNLDQGQIDTACGDETTVLPPGITMPANWPCDD
jgi:uncharacterized protein YjbI with pentapeptide repeats